MSIVTDALNRLQSERSQNPPTPSSEPTSPVVSIFSRSPHKPVSLSSPLTRKIIQGLALVVVLIVIGVCAYLWGLTMVPTVPELAPPPPVDSVEVDDASPIAAGEPAVPVEGAGAPPSDAVPESSKTRPVEEQPVPAPREAALPEVPVSRLPETQITIPVRKTAKAVPAPRRRPIPPPTPPLPDTRPAEKTVVPTAQAVPPAQGGRKSESPTRSERLVPSGTTALERRLSIVKQLINRKRYGQALTLLQPLFLTSPGQWEPWFWRGTAHLGLGELDQAEESFVEGLARDSTIPHLWVQRALVSQQRGYFGEAVESLRQAELLAPELPEVQLNLGYSLEKQGEPVQAVEHYQRYLALTEGHPSYQSARKKVFNRMLHQQRSANRNP